MEKAVFMAAHPDTGQEGTFHVCYNPSDLSFTDNSLSMELFFDGGDGRKVQEVVCGFLGMLSSQSAKKVTFGWGGLIFPGKVSAVHAEYTRFSSSGEPLMGKVRITLEQVGREWTFTN